MRLNEELLERVEELFDLIPNDAEEMELDAAMDRLRRFLEEDVDGVTLLSAEDLAHGAICRMEEIWDLIPETDKQVSDLEESFEEIMRDLETGLSISSDEDDFIDVPGDDVEAEGEWD